MSHSLARGATSREMGVIARLTTAEERAGSPTVRAALCEGLELIRELIADRHRRQGLDEQMDEARADDASWDPPCPDS